MLWVLLSGSSSMNAASGYFFRISVSASRTFSETRIDPSNMGVMSVGPLLSIKRMWGIYLTSWLKRNIGQSRSGYTRSQQSYNFGLQGVETDHDDIHSLSFAVFCRSTSWGRITSRPPRWCQVLHTRHTTWKVAEAPLKHVDRS